MAMACVARFLVPSRFVGTTWTTAGGILGWMEIGDARRGGGGRFARGRTRMEVSSAQGTDGAGGGPLVTTPLRTPTCTTGSLSAPLSSAPRSLFACMCTHALAPHVTALSLQPRTSSPFSSSWCACVHKTPGGTSWSRKPGGDPGGGVVRVTRGASERPGATWAGRGWVRCGSVVRRAMGHMGWRRAAMVGRDGAVAGVQLVPIHTVARAAGGMTKGMDAPTSLITSSHSVPPSRALHFRVLHRPLPVSWPPCPYLCVLTWPHLLQLFASTVPVVTPLETRGIANLCSSRRVGIREGTLAAALGGPGGATAPPPRVASTCCATGARRAAAAAVRPAAARRLGRTWRATPSTRRLRTSAPSATSSAPRSSSALPPSTLRLSSLAGASLAA